MVCKSAVFSSVISVLENALDDDKFPMRYATTKVLGRIVAYQAKCEAATAEMDLILLLVTRLQDDSSDVRRKALSGLKRVAKENPVAIMPSSSVGRALAECLRDSNTPVHVAAERCALHVFQLSKGAVHVQAAQKFITGLDARRLSKLSDNSDDSIEDGAY